jgi:hypothetical protein
MTATIAPPPGVPNLSRTDPAERTRDYQRSLAWYLSLPREIFSRVVFVDNSCSDLSPLRELAAGAGAEDFVEFISFQGLDYPPHFDRAYGEFRLLDHAMSNSKSILSSDPDADRIWKVTGRYIVKNIGAIVDDARSDFELCANFRNWPKRWVDTYFLGWTRDGYEALVRDVYHRLKTNVPGIPQGISGEELFRSWLEQPLFRKRRIVKRFRRAPILEGIRGADGRGYSSDDGWKIRIRTFAGRYLPFIWI